MSAETLNRDEATRQDPEMDDSRDEQPSDETSEALSKDVLFEILKNQRRRDALQYLKDNDGEAKLSDMAEYIAAKENDIDIQALSSSQRKRVYIGLYQCHLPKMASSGVIDFDKNRGDIELREAASQLDPFLDGDITGSDSVSRRNLYVALGVTAAVAAGVVGIPGFSVVPDAAWAVLSASALVVLTAFETFDTRLS